MIISRQMAEQAAQDLGFAELTPALNEPAVLAMFKMRAKSCHPDKGGTSEEFVVIDRAKCILVKWFNRPIAEVSVEIASDKCPMCNGTGRRELRRGFHSMTMVCGSCRGMGERVQTDKVEE